MLAPSARSDASPSSFGPCAASQIGWTAPKTIGGWPGRAVAASGTEDVAAVRVGNEEDDVGLLRHVGAYPPECGDAEMRLWTGLEPGAQGWLVPALAQGAVATVRAPSDTRVRLGQNAPVRVRESGFHDVHVSGGGVRSLVFATNSLPQESNLESLDVEKFVQTIGTRKQDRARSSLADSSEGGSTRSIDRAWWFILLACALLLVLETVVSNRLSKRVTAR